MGAITAFLIFVGIPLVLWLVLVSSTYAIEAKHPGAGDGDGAVAGPSAATKAPATREGGIFAWTTLAGIVITGLCFSWTPTSWPSLNPATDYSIWQTVAFIILLVGTACAFSCRTPRIYTGAYAAAAGAYAGFALPFWALVYFTDETGQGAVGVTLFDIFGSLGLLIALSIFGAVRRRWLIRHA